MSPRGHLGNAAGTPRSASSPLSMSPRGHISPRAAPQPPDRRASFDAPRSPAPRRSSLDRGGGLTSLGTSRRSLEHGFSGFSGHSFSGLSPVVRAPVQSSDGFVCTQCQQPRRLCTWVSALVQGNWLCQGIALAVEQPVPL